MVLTAEGEPWAYVGGIDISVDRWDTTGHSSPPERQKDVLDAWHDVQCAIQESSVGDIAANFTDRWNERKAPVRSNPGDLPAPIRSPLRVPQASKGTMIVPRLRKFACNRTYDFMQEGEQTSRQGSTRRLTDRPVKALRVSGRPVLPAVHDGGPSG